MRTVAYLLNCATSAFLLWIGKGIALAELFAQISRERRALARLSDDQLHDIGISRKEAVRESKRSWVEIPVNRLRRKPPVLRWARGAARQSTSRSR